MTVTHHTQIITDDPTDNMFLECAVSGKAKVIISGDEHLLELKKYQRIPIYTPRAFVDDVFG